MENIKPLFLQLSRKEQKSVVEALIFASEEPLSLDSIFKILLNKKNPNTELFKYSDNIANDNENQSVEDNYPEIIDANSFTADDVAETEPENVSNKNEEVSVSYFEELITEINQELFDTNRPFQIIYIANGYQYATRSEFGALIQQITKAKSKRRLTQASLETLAIIAYRQPITKPEIEQIRGVNSGDIVNTLIEKNLVAVVGRKDTLGKPLLFGTTSEFLKMFGLKNIIDLPKLRELEDLTLEDSRPDSVIELSINSTNRDEMLEIQSHFDDDLVN
jgi:segregation and condensation protein B